MKTRSNMPLFVVECDNVKTLSNSQIDLLRCGDYLVKKDASGEHAYKVTFKSDTGMCLTYHDASVIETQSYDKINGNWVYNSEDKTELPVNEGDLVVNDLEVKGDAKLFENIVDKDGHKRFVEGNIDIVETEGFTKKYGKWSLSGSHLMLVVAVSIENNITWVGGKKLYEIELPQWIMDKIVPVATSRIENQNELLFDNDATSAQNLTSYLSKIDGKLVLTLSPLSTTAKRYLRVANDLLIDNE